VQVAICYEAIAPLIRSASRMTALRPKYATAAEATEITGKVINARRNPPQSPYALRTDRSSHRRTAADADADSGEDEEEERRGDGATSQRSKPLHQGEERPMR